MMEWWKGLEMKLKIIMMIIAILSSLGVGRVAVAGMDLIQKVAEHGTSISILAEEQIKANYNFEKKVLNDNIENYKRELREARKDCGGSDLSKCDEERKNDYIEAQESLKKDKGKLSKLEEEMEKLKIEKLQKLKKGGK